MVTLSNLTSGGTKSCGCLQRQRVERLKASTRDSIGTPVGFQGRDFKVLNLKYRRLVSRRQQRPRETARLHSQE